MSLRPCVLFLVSCLLCGATQPALGFIEVSVEGTVTLVDKSRSLIVLQERGRARAVVVDSLPPPLRVGERVSITGRQQTLLPMVPDASGPIPSTQKTHSTSSLAITIEGARVTPLGEGDLRAPKHVRIDRDWADERNFLWSEVDGTVTFVSRCNGDLTLELTESDSRALDPDARMSVRVFNWGDRPVAHLLNRRVRVLGVCEQVRNAKGKQVAGMLWAQDPRKVTPLDFSNRDWRNMEAVPLSDLFQPNQVLSLGRKLLVRATVAIQDKTTGVCLLRGDDRSQKTLEAHVIDGEIPQQGRLIDIVGTLGWRDGAPVLLDAYQRRQRAKMDDGVAPFASADSKRRSLIADLLADTAEHPAAPEEVICIRGVVTLKDLAPGGNLLFVQDETGGASFRISTALLELLHPVPGQLLEAEIKLQPLQGETPFVLVSGVALGWGELPRPLPFPDRIVAGKANAHWVEARGVVRSSGNGTMTVMEREGLLSVWVGGTTSSQALASYVDCFVTLRGVLATQRNSTPLLRVPSLQFVQVNEEAPRDPFNIPSYPIGVLRAWEVSPQSLHRVKLTGTVTYRDGRILCLQDDTGGARVLMDASGDFDVGNCVEVVGFPERNAESLTLVEVLLRKTAPDRAVAPVAMSLDDMLEGRFDGSLVRLEGILLDQKLRAGRQLLELQNGKRAFTAILTTAAGELPSLLPGSRIQVTGVNQMQFTSHSYAVTSGASDPIPATMEVLLRSASDLVLLSSPPWWNWRHSVGVVAALACVLTGAIAWIRTLRRRVEERTHELRDAMNRLRKETEISATLAERDRLAAEIHDTLEQGLSGIMMQLDGVDSQLKEDQEGARPFLEMARRMVRFSREEVRHSLWNLESALLHDGNLGIALSEIASQMNVGNAVQVSVKISGVPHALPPAVEHHLLRCSQEALNNAIKHAAAHTVRMELSYDAESVRLEVADDGLGFVPESVLTEAGRSLGLRNLRSRSRKIKGQLDIVSQPGQGTVIRLTVPLQIRVDKPAKTDPLPPR